MKRFLLTKFVFPMLLTMVCGMASGQSVAVTPAGYEESTRREKLEKATSETLDKLLKYAEQGNYEAFGKMMIYSGRDPHRTLKVMMNPNNPHEQLEIENTLNYLRHWLEKSALYHAKTFRIVKGLDGDDLYFWDVEFTTVKGKSKMFVFSFMDFEDGIVFIRAEKK